jgi:AbrB family looped-hinge helix DNA binding protein
METTRMSNRGRIVLPKSVLTARAWGPGTEFTVEETGDGILLRPVPVFPETTLDQVAGCLPYRGKAITLRETKAATGREVIRRHARGRY